MSKARATKRALVKFGKTPAKGKAAKSKHENSHVTTLAVAAKGSTGGKQGP